MYMITEKETKVNIDLPDLIVEQMMLNQLMIPQISDCTQLILEFVKPKYFQNHEYNQVYTIIKAYYEKYEKCPSSTFLKNVFLHDNYEDNRCDLNKAVDDIVGFSTRI